MAAHTTSLPLLSSSLPSSAPHSRTRMSPATPVTALQPGETVYDVRLSAAQPLRCFVLQLHTWARVTVTVQEACTRGRCVLLLSPHEAAPSEETAVWSLRSPAARRTLQLHPADAQYRLGALYVCLRYCQESGSTRVQLRVTMQQTFCAVWLRRVRCAAVLTTVAAADDRACERAACNDDDDGGVADTVDGNSSSSQHALATCSSLYVGQWCGRARDGCGVAFYCVTSCSNNNKTTRRLPLLLTSMYERCSVPWSSHSLVDTGDDGNGSSRGGDDDSNSCGTAAAARSARAQLAALCTQLGLRLHNSTTDASNGSSSSGGCIAEAIAAATATAADVPHWRVLTLRTRSGDDDDGDEDSVVTDMDVYDGEWVADRRHGVGVYQWCDAVYVGQWAAGVREGYGVYRHANGSYYCGTWHADRRHGTGEALLLPPTAATAAQSHDDGDDDTTAAHLPPCIYRGEWRDGQREGDGALEYVMGGRDTTTTTAVVVQCTWHANTPATHVHACYGNGDVYDGEWLHATAERHGRGTLTTVMMSPNSSSTGSKNNDAEVLYCTHTHTWQHDKRVGDGVVCYPRGGVRFCGVWDGHTGACVSGAYYYACGDVYTGAWDDARGVREGYGVCHYANGDVYEGAWHADERDGQGTMRYAVALAASAAPRQTSRADHDKEEDTATQGYDVYVGTWSHDVRCGHGTLTCVDGSVYEGAWAKDKRCGHGTQRDADGSYYVGGWSDDHRTGKGVYYRAAMRVRYEGTFLHNRLQGLGRSEHAATASVTSAVGDKGNKNSTATQRDHYDGSWLDGQRHGCGTLRRANGDVLRATWHHDEAQDGHVVYDYRGSGGRYEGEWRAGQRHGHGRYEHADDGSVYEGEWLHDAPHGRGRVTRARGGGTTLDGQWAAGVWVDGVGVLTYADGSVYRGTLVRGVPHGEGTLTYDDGTTFSGTFVHGRYEL